MAWNVLGIAPLVLLVILGFYTPYPTGRFSVILIYWWKATDSLSTYIFMPSTRGRSIIAPPPIQYNIISGSLYAAQRRPGILRYICMAHDYPRQMFSFHIYLVMINTSIFPKIYIFSKFPHIYGQSSQPF